MHHPFAEAIELVHGDAVTRTGRHLDVTLDDGRFYAFDIFGEGVESSHHGVGASFSTKSEGSDLEFWLPSESVVGIKMAYTDLGDHRVVDCGSEEAGLALVLIASAVQELRLKGFL